MTWEKVAKAYSTSECEDVRNNDCYYMRWKIDFHRNAFHGEARSAKKFQISFFFIIFLALNFIFRQIEKNIVRLFCNRVKCKEGNKAFFPQDLSNWSFTSLLLSLLFCIAIHQLIFTIKKFTYFVVLNSAQRLRVHFMPSN